MPGSGSIPAPNLSLPKGGGAVRGIGETFQAQAFTGAATLSIPLPVSPCRGFEPRLSLEYSSGSGNGAFGIGFSLSLPSIARKTTRAFPTYDDSDTFLLSSADDLVPSLIERDGAWTPDRVYRIPGQHGANALADKPPAAGLFFTVTRYRPRAEGSFARIERWVRSDDGDTHWRVTAQDNTTSIYGETQAARIADPADATRVFAWLIERAYDDTGGQVAYAYLADGANRHIRTIRYGNDRPGADPASDDWHFEVGFAYSQPPPAAPPANESPAADRPRPDPFSSYRPGFELRTSLRCTRVALAHRFAELGQGPVEVSATMLEYDAGQQISLLSAVRQAGYRDGAAAELPPLALHWSPFALEDAALGAPAFRPLHLDGGRGVPDAVAGDGRQMVDLYGEGLPGILVSDADTLLYARPLGGASYAPFAPPHAFPVERDLRGGQSALMDLAGDGRLDLVVADGSHAGFYESRRDGGWEPFQSFDAAPTDLLHPQRRLADVTGDGLADLLLFEEGSVRYYTSRGRRGYGRPVSQAAVAALPITSQPDAREVVRFCDPFGDGGSHLVRVRSGSVACWPSLGYGRFGPKVEIANPPSFDGELDGARLFFADLDGSGATDLVYAHPDRVDIYLNRSGDRFSDPISVALPRPWHALSQISFADVLGNGTTCLVFTSLNPDLSLDQQYCDFTGGTKPYLLTGLDNSVGATTSITYRPSTAFYLADERAGAPWVTRLPFPVQVVERTETTDQIGGSRLVTSYTYHHGYFDPVDREFRGFGRVERQDAETFDASTARPHDAPPVLTRSWYHTGDYADADQIAQRYAAEYYAGDPRASALPPAVLGQSFALAPPDNLAEAYRALHGHVLREEVYGLDQAALPDLARHPYTVAESRYAVRLVQPRAGQPYAVCLVYGGEQVERHYERDPTDPRVSHTLTLEVDAFGNVLRSLAVGYGRRAVSPDAALTADDHGRQSQPLITYSEQTFTNPVLTADAYRAPLPAEARTFELAGFAPQGGAERFALEEWTRVGFALLGTATDIAYEQPAGDGPHRRLIEHVRTLYRPDDLGTSRRNDPLALLPLGSLESRALPGETYTLALTPGLLEQVYVRDGQRLLPAEPADLMARGGYVDLDGDGSWWARSGRAFLSPGATDTAAQELAYASAHFFLPHRFRDPFHTDQASTESSVSFDAYDLLPVAARDALGNMTLAENDYRVLRARQVTDANGNRAAVAFDALGLVVATAVMGKAGEAAGDLLEGFETDLSLAELQAFMAAPQAQAAALLGSATSRVVYDADRFRRAGQPPFAATLARETHVHDPSGPGSARIRVRFIYSDGFGREVQHKMPAEPGQAPARQPNLTLPSGDVGPGALVQSQAALATPRWISSGRTVYDNKGRPVRRYEPFFSATHLYESEDEAAAVGVSSTLLYDPAGRVVATLHPNHTWEKVVFDAWRQETWTASDTALIDDPRTDPDVGHLFRGLPDADVLPTWHALRTNASHAVAFTARYPDAAERAGQIQAAEKAGVHAATPTVAHFDALGRVFLSVAHNRFQRGDAAPAEEFYATRVVLDIEGRERELIDAHQRVVLRSTYDMLGRQIHQHSMDAGERWLLSDIAGQPLLAWDSRGLRFRSEYDALRRLLRSWVAGADPAHPERELLSERLVYGEQRPDAERANLRGRPWLHLDQAGLVVAEEHDFKGNLVRSTRRLAREYRAAIDWSPAEAALLGGAQPDLAALAPWLEAESYASGARYDALNRPVELTEPDRSVIRHGYDQSGLLARVEAAVGGAAAATAFVTGVEYNAKGQRARVAYGNGVSTRSTYDPETFELARLSSTRGSDGAALQDLSYTHDPAGNITRIRDGAQQTVYFRNRAAAPGADYTYDAVSRLIAASGREHLGQAGAPPTPYSPDDAPRAGLPQPGEGGAMGRYAEEYVYDAVGNLLRMQHRGEAGQGWTRSYVYDEASPLDPAARSNRLSRTTLGDASPIAEPYAYDAHGNMTAMPHLALMRWNEHDQLRAAARQVVANGGTPETTWYVYDAGGQRVRAVTERQAAAGQAPRRKSERVYLGDFEVYRAYAGDGQALTLERQTLRITDDSETVALVETRTAGNDRAPRQLARYQLGEHLGSASLELDDRAQIITYEEYSPFGSTTYQAARSQTEAPKRYRYAGKERDETTGLYDYGLRLYAPWLGRWTSADPAGTVDGPNLYAFVGGNPISFIELGGTGRTKQTSKPKGYQPRRPKFIGTQVDWLTARVFRRERRLRREANRLGNPLGERNIYLVSYTDETHLITISHPPGQIRQAHEGLSDDELGVIFTVEHSEGQTEFIEQAAFQGKKRLREATTREQCELCRYNHPSEVPDEHSFGYPYSGTVDHLKSDDLHTLIDENQGKKGKLKLTKTQQDDFTQARASAQWERQHGEDQNPAFQRDLENLGEDTSDEEYSSDDELVDVDLELGRQVGIKPGEEKKIGRILFRALKPLQQLGKDRLEKGKAWVAQHRQQQKLKQQQQKLLKKKK
jgi:RHS repeat-associated protein